MMLIVTSLALVVLAMPRAAHAFVYWGDTDHYALGRAGPDGQGATETFVNLHYAALPCGVAVRGPYIYWGDQLGAIGRTRIDGTGTPDLHFITGATEPCGLAVYGDHLYWANRSIHGSIGRASLAGPLDVQQNFVPSEQATGGSDLWEPCSVAADRTGIYWSDALGGGIGHAKLDGTGEGTLLQDANQGCGVALGGGYLYWTNDPFTGNGMIGRALESGAAANPSFMTVAGGSCGLAVFSHYLFYAEGAIIDRTDLNSPDPTAAATQIFAGARNACGVAVDSLSAGRLQVLGTRSSRNGVRLELKVSNPGQVVVRQASSGRPLVRTEHAHVARAGRISLPVRLTVAGARALRQHPNLKLRLRVTYTPTGGITSTATPTITLKAG